MKRIAAILLIVMVFSMKGAFAEEKNFMDWLSDFFSGNILKAVDKVNNGGSAEDIDAIVEDYFWLVKSVHGAEKPKYVSISRLSYAYITVDDVEYDLYEIPHDDGDNTERRMEIEILLSGSEAVSIDAVEDRLNGYIQENW